MLAFMLLPLMLIGIMLQMYIGLIARSSFVAYYVSRTTPPPAQPVSPEADEAASTDDEFIIEPGPAPQASDDNGNNPKD